MDLTARFGTITLSRTLEVFAPIFVLAHNWNIDDIHEKVLACKKQYIEEALLQEVKCGRLHGKIRGRLLTDHDEEPLGYELDYKATSFDIKEATCFLFGLLRRHGNSILHQLVKEGDVGSGLSRDEDVAEENEIDSDICNSVEAMPVSTLKKKVAELSNEKVKWDKSLVIAAKVGLLFYEKGLSKPSTEKAFKAEYAKEFAGIPNKTVSLIYKSLPAEYRNLGEKPPKETNDLDPVIKAAVLAGAQSGERDSMNAKSLRKSLSMEGYEVPSDGVLEKIIAAVMTLEVDEYE